MQTYKVKRSDSDKDTDLLQSHCHDAVETLWKVRYEKLTTEGRVAFDNAIVAIAYLRISIKDRRFFQRDEDLELTD